MADVALAELARRIERANEAIRARRLTAAQAQHRLRPWAAIAAWFGADVRPFLDPHPGVYKDPDHAERVEAWIDFCPPRQRADDALRALAEECRRAYQVALTRPDEPQRAANLARLDLHLSIAAGVPAWQPEPAQAKAA